MHQPTKKLVYGQPAQMKFCSARKTFADFPIYDAFRHNELDSHIDANRPGYQTSLINLEASMLEKIGSYDAKTKLPEILRRVEAGESFTITNRGKPVADIVPSRTGNHLKIQSAIDDILAVKKHSASDEMLAQLREAGRK
jgi:prevent-host-death family protein